MVGRSIGLQLPPRGSWRGGNPFGYLIAFSMLILEVLLAPMIAAQTVSQLSAGISFTPGEIIGPMIGFVILAVLALWVLAILLRNISD
jgi:hypothetical protein